MATNKERYAANPEYFKARAAAYRAAEPEKVRSQAKRARKRLGPDVYRAANLKRNYGGFTLAAYDAMLAGQGGVCAICKVPSDKRLHVDHDHKSGMVRGLLCNTCNVGVGMFRDSQRLLLAAAAYLSSAEAPDGD